MMKQAYLFLLLMIFAASSSLAQSVRYTVWLRDKNDSPYSLSKPGEYLSQKAIQRRTRQHIPLDSTDLPVNPAYLQSLKNVPGVTLVSTSRWLNLALVEINDPSAIEDINALPFVTGLKDVVISAPARPNDFLKHLPSSGIASADDEAFAAGPSTSQLYSEEAPCSPPEISADTINYGSNAAQVKIHEGNFLHTLGLRGQGIAIAMLDAGFSKYLTNPVFDSMRMNNRVKDEYDFVNNESSVNEDHTHGAYCLSLMAANRPGVMVGTAPNADYLLYRTEDVSSEKPIEEVYWLIAAEKADSLGADLISSSLGYTTFDNPAYTHPYAQRDGNTAVITIAADLAAKKGMIVLCSAGNSGTATDHTKYIMCPADADSVVTVGAVNTSGEIGTFSCIGPNGAGKRKPNVVSVGWAAVYANTLGNTATGNGTSFAAPNIAGLFACLWQGFPDFTNMEIIDAVERSADKYLHPDNAYGYGIPNFRVAYELLTAKREERLTARLKGSWITAYPVPFKQQFTVFLKAPASGNATIRLLDISGRVLQVKRITVTENNYHTILMTPPVMAAGIYYIQYSDGKNNSVIKTIAR